MKDPILNDSIVPDMGEGTRTTDVARVPSTPTDGRTLDQLCQREARRWLCLLGDEMARTPYDYEALRERSKSVRVPLRVLARQKRAFDAKGIDGLLPDWTELSTKEWQAAIKQYQLLGDEADAVEMTDALIAGLATRNGWTPQRAERWLHRYRIGGLWGLAPHHNPGKRQRHARDERRFANLATLSKEEMDVALESIRERLLLLGDLVNYDQVTNEQVEEQAKKTGKSARTIRYYLADYRDARLAGLARRPRSDKSNRHSINGDMEELIRAIRLTNPDWSDRAVLEEACKMARVLGEPEPSEFHVRDIVDRIPAPIRALADGREREFRNKYKITYRLEWDGKIVLQFDWTRVDVLVKDMRAGHEGEEVRPFHLLAFAPESRAAPASLFVYDRPDRYDVATGMYRALLAPEPLGGQINEASTDHGLELVAEHVHQLVKGMDINVHVCKPYHPEERGGCERFFKTLNTRLWSKERGYVGSNTVERNPNARATKTLAQLEATYNTFLDEYHNEVHSETGETPLDFLRTHYLREPVDPRKLDLLLKERHNRKVIKTGIKHLNRLYWAPALGPLVSQHVVIRAAPDYTRPDEVEVFHVSGNKEEWVCTAVAMDSERGRAVTATDIAAAQRHQRHQARGAINQAKDTIEEMTRRIEELGATTILSTGDGSGKVAVEPEVHEDPEPPVSLPVPSADGTPTKKTGTSTKQPKRPTMMERLAARRARDEAETR